LSDRAEEKFLFLRTVASNFDNASPNFPQPPYYVAAMIAENVQIKIF